MLGLLAGRRQRFNATQVVGHRELGDLAELAGAAAVARFGIALGVRSGAPVRGQSRAPSPLD